MPMLTFVVDLDIHPGEVPETIHMKQGTNDVEIIFRIAANSEATMETGGTAILKATKPDGSECFQALSIDSITPHIITVVVPDVAALTDVAGAFEGTLSIVDTEDAVTQENYEDFDLITVQPFSMDIERSAMKWF